MFPTEAHMNMGGSLHGGAVMSFIDMAMFAGGLCAGMERGHYVTLDLTTHFLARGQAGIAARRACRAGQADPRACLPAGRGQAGRRALLQLQRHLEAGEPAERTAAAMSGPVRAAYDALIAAGELKPDPGAGARGRRARPAGASLATARPASRRLFGSRKEGPAGVYLWGGVGRGKSMLMDLAFAHIDVEPKRRVHFHEFMIETHARLREAREREEGDPIEPVAEEIADEAKLLCFDEMQVTNPADAMILSRLFGKLLEQGVKVVTTSNRPPRDLYKDGLNRELFLPFIELIERRMLVVEVNGPTDYRLDRLAGVEVWHVPNGPEATAALSRAFFQLTDYPVEDRAKVPAEDTRRRRRTHAARAQEPQGRRGLLVQAAVRRAARRGRLSRHRPPLSYGDHRRHSGDGRRDAQRGGALRHADRRALRA